MSRKNNNQIYTHPVSAEEELELNSTEPTRLLPNSDKLVIHTVPAQKIIEGYRDERNYGAWGLRDFCNRMAAAYYASGLDDPYADQLLVNVYNECIKVRRVIVKLEEEYLKKIKQVQGLELAVREALEPMTYNISLKTPYGYLVAYLLIEFDRFCRTIISAKMAVLMSERNTIEKPILDLRRKIRRLLSAPLHWRYTGITRTDIDNQHKSADRAKKVNKFAVDPSVLSREKRAPYAPRIRDIFDELDDPKYST